MFRPIAAAGKFSASIAREAGGLAHDVGKSVAHGATSAYGRGVSGIRAGSVAAGVAAKYGTMAGRAVAGAAVSGWNTALRAKDAAEHFTEDQWDRHVIDPAADKLGDKLGFANGDGKKMAVLAGDLYRPLGNISLLTGLLDIPLKAVSLVVDAAAVPTAVPTAGASLTPAVALNIFEEIVSWTSLLSGGLSSDAEHFYAVYLTYEAHHGAHNNAKDVSHDALWSTFWSLCSFAGKLQELSAADTGKSAAGAAKDAAKADDVGSAEKAASTVDKLIQTVNSVKVRLAKGLADLTRPPWFSLVSKLHDFYDWFGNKAQKTLQACLWAYDLIKRAGKRAASTAAFCAQSPFLQSLAHGSLIHPVVAAKRAVKQAGHHRLHRSPLSGAPADHSSEEAHAAAAGAAPGEVGAAVSSFAAEIAAHSSAVHSAAGSVTPPEGGESGFGSFAEGHPWVKKMMWVGKNIFGNVALAAGKAIQFIEKTESWGAKLGMSAAFIERVGQFAKFVPLLHAIAGATSLIGLLSEEGQKKLPGAKEEESIESLALFKRMFGEDFATRHPAWHRAIMVGVKLSPWADAIGGVLELAGGVALLTGVGAAAAPGLFLAGEIFGYVSMALNPMKIIGPIVKAYQFVTGAARWAKDKALAGAHWTKETAVAGGHWIGDKASSLWNWGKRKAGAAWDATKSAAVNFGNRVADRWKTPRDGEMTGPFFGSPEAQRDVTAEQAVAEGATLFVNGIDTSYEDHGKAAQRLATSLGPSTVVVGVYNATSGMGMDLAQCLVDKATLGQLNPATNTLTRLITTYGDAQKEKGGLHIVAHSQGSIILADALFRARKKKADIGSYDVTTYGNAAVLFPQGPQYHHRNFDSDAVATGVGTSSLGAHLLHWVHGTALGGAMMRRMGLADSLADTTVLHHAGAGIDPHHIDTDGGYIDRSKEFKDAEDAGHATPNAGASLKQTGSALWRGGKETVGGWLSPMQTRLRSFMDWLPGMSSKSSASMLKSVNSTQAFSHDIEARLGGPGTTPPPFPNAPEAFPPIGATLPGPPPPPPGSHGHHRHHHHHHHHAHPHAMDPRVLATAAASGQSEIRNPKSAIQRSGTGDHPDVDADALRNRLLKQSSGTSVDSNVREKLSGHLGFDPGMARIHTGPAAAEAARGLRAEAFTIGRDVFFGAGMHDPASAKGLGLMAHELTHVGQQTGTIGDKARFFTQSGGDEMEQEAQQTAERVLANAGSRGGLFVENYVRQYETEDDHGLSKDDQERLDRISIMALQEAERMLKGLGYTNSPCLNDVDVEVSIDLAECSDEEIQVQWAEAIVASVRTTTIAPDCACPEAKGLDPQALPLMMPAIQRQAAGGSSCPGQPEFCMPYDHWWEIVGAQAFARSAVISYIDAMISPEAAGLWVRYLNRKRGDSLVPINFSEHSAVGQSFVDSKTTAERQNELVGKIKAAIPSLCLNIPADQWLNVDVINILPQADLNYPINFDQIHETPGNIAGGVGGSDAGPDLRQVFGHVSFIRTVDDTGATTGGKMRTHLVFYVKDAVDLCPGDCGAAIEQIATIPLSRLEASGQAYDVPFEVSYHAPVVEIALDASAIKSCTAGAVPPSGGEIGEGPGRVGDRRRKSVRPREKERSLQRSARDGSADSGPLEEQAEKIGAKAETAQSLPSGTVYHHKLSKDGLEAILASGMLKPGEARQIAGGGTAVRAHVGPAPTPQSGEVYIEFTTDIAPEPVGNPDHPNFWRWVLPEGSDLAIRVVRVVRTDTEDVDEDGDDDKIQLKPRAGRRRRKKAGAKEKKAEAVEKAVAGPRLRTSLDSQVTVTKSGTQYAASLHLENKDGASDAPIATYEFTKPPERNETPIYIEDLVSDSDPSTATVNIMYDPQKVALTLVADSSKNVCGRALKVNVSQVPAAKMPISQRSRIRGVGKTGFKADGPETMKSHLGKGEADQVIAGIVSAEGGFASTEASDAGIFTWGQGQWTVKSGQLQKVLAFVKSRRADLWDKYWGGSGLELGGSAKSPVFLYGNKTYKSSEADMVKLFRPSRDKNKQWTELFALAGSDPQVQRLQREYLRMEVSDQLKTPIKGAALQGLSPDDWLTTAGKAYYYSMYKNLPGVAMSNLREAVAQAGNEHKKGDPTVADAVKEKVSEALRTRFENSSVSANGFDGPKKHIVAFWGEKGRAKALAESDTEIKAADQKIQAADGRLKAAGVSAADQAAISKEKAKALSDKQWWTAHKAAMQARQSRYQKTNHDMEAVSKGKNLEPELPEEAPAKSESTATK